MAAAVDASTSCQLLPVCMLLRLLLLLLLLSLISPL
jgi:hypothetical protein